MTSIEVAGVALGALPILVSSLKQFERAFAPIKSSGSLRREIQFVHIELESQQLILQQTLRVLLNEACSDSELEELLSDPTSSLWRSREIESALVESLGSDAYAILLHMFTRLFDTVSSLEKSLKSITGASINGSLNFRSRLKWILSEDKTRKRLNEVHEQNRRMTEIINLSLYKHQFERRRAIENINSSLVKVLEVQKLAEDVETFTSEASEREQNSEDDRRSTYTVESEIEGGSPSLSYLSLSVQAVDDPVQLLKEEALLDTGATASAISVSTAKKLGLTIVETTETVVKTSILHQGFPVGGKVHLNLRWKDKDENPCGTKIWVYVVYGLSKSMLLSHDFTRRHDEVWAVAKTVPHVAEELNITWFNKSSKAQQEAEEDFRKRQAQANQTRAAMEKLARDTELNIAVGNTASSSTTPPNPAGSSAGSSITPTSGSASSSTNP